MSKAKANAKRKHVLILLSQRFMQANWVKEWDRRLICDELIG
jgi:hypothetical protein